MRKPEPHAVQKSILINNPAINQEKLSQIEVRRWL